MLVAVPLSPFRLVAEEGDNQLIELLYSLPAQGAENRYILSCRRA